MYVHEREDLRSELIIAILRWLSLKFCFRHILLEALAAAGKIIYIYIYI